MMNVLKEYLKMVIWCCGFQKIQKLKKANSFFPWIGPFRVKKVFDNNIVQLSTLSNEDVALLDINQLKPYQNPIELIILGVVITIIIKNLEKQFYQGNLERSQALVKDGNN
jgi:hypothetical protein